MNDPIMFSPHDIWTMFLAICGAVITISAAAAVVVKLVDKLKEPDKKQNERLESLENEVKEIHDSLNLGNKRFERDSTRITELEEAMKKSNQIVIESLQVLIEHGIDGNNTEGMKEMKHKLDKYLLEK